MALYPGALPVAGSASASDTLAAAGHTALHNTDRDEIRAVATKIGTGSSTPAAGRVLRSSSSGTSTWGQVVLTTDVTGVLPVANGGTGGATATDARTNLSVYSQTQVDDAIADAKEALYPVGSIYINATSSTNPATLLGFGTWVAWGVGRAIVGIDATQTEFDTAEETGGAKTHTLTTGEMPAHEHDAAARFLSPDINTGDVVPQASGVTTYSYSTNTTSSTGGGGAHNNLQPYQVGYVWKRTA